MKNIFLSIFSLFFSFTLAQEPFNKLETDSLDLDESNLIHLETIKTKFKISGYIQTQFQYGQPQAELNIGNENNDLTKSFNRIGIRRGRLKSSYSKGVVEAVFQVDLTEKGLGLKDAYITILEPYGKFITFKTGVFNRPFGYEVPFSSSERESPERSTIMRTFFPNERDLGGMLTIQAPGNSIWSLVKLEAGFFAGNGIKQEIDNKRDFISHLSIENQRQPNFIYGLGFSYYNGHVFQGTENVYKIQGEGFALDNSIENKGNFSKREYFGLDSQISFLTQLGTTKLKAEYLFGLQPGTEKHSKSPNQSNLPTHDTYLRNFQGGYILLAQKINNSPLSTIIKYDWYDPNTKVSGNGIGQNGVNIGDLAISTLGIGLIWEFNKDLMLRTYYDIVKNETSTMLPGFQSDIKDNAFTLMLQYKF